MPSLLAILTAAERKLGRALSRSELEGVVDGSAAIAMERADAVGLERSRGYADIVPELAWEQWQLMRTNP